MASNARGKGVDLGRRRLLGSAGAAALLGGLVTPRKGKTMNETTAVLRWGIVGTGMIANNMAPMMKQARFAEAAAVSSRRMETAREFATSHGVAATYDDWGKLLDSPDIDAVYVATPTSVREEISIAAANKGKHVLAEKPFASAASVRRIAAACREHGVAFMDGTHFVHHPRTAAIRDYVSDRVGSPMVLDSTFQFFLDDAGNIRLNPQLEPMGALGDAGWYNMRAIVEFLPDAVALQDATVYTRRHAETGAVSSAVGVMQFDHGAIATFNCGFASGALTMDLRVTGSTGAIYLNDFVLTAASAKSHFTYRKGGLGPSGTTEQIDIASTQPAAAQMFDDFAQAAADPARRDAWIAASERTQELLDAAWHAANRQA